MLFLLCSCFSGTQVTLYPTRVQNPAHQANLFFIRPESLGLTEAISLAFWHRVDVCESCWHFKEPNWRPESVKRKAIWNTPRLILHHWTTSQLTRVTWWEWGAGAGARVLKIQFITKFGHFALSANCYRLQRKKKYCLHMFFFGPVGLSDGRINQLESNLNILTKADSS